MHTESGHPAHYSHQGQEPPRYILLAMSHTQDYTASQEYHLQACHYLQEASPATA